MAASGEFGPAFNTPQPSEKDKLSVTKWFQVRHKDLNRQINKAKDYEKQKIKQDHQPKIQLDSAQEVEARCAEKTRNCTA